MLGNRTFSTGSKGRTRHKSSSSTNPLEEGTGYFSISKLVLPRLFKIYVSEFIPILPLRSGDLEVGFYSKTD